LKVLQDDIQDQTPRKPANADGEPSLQEAFKDAYVLIGVSALGVFDMRNFPFDNNVAGVEGQATMLDNLLSNDLISQAATGTGHAVMLMLMILGAIVFGLATLKFEAVPALLLGVLAFGGFGYIDTKLLFARAQDWNTGFIYLEMGTIFLFTLAAKYVVEEKNKKFIRSAFTKYVAPTIVDSIMKDPTKLSLGGERKDLTILFSDIRGFTTFSEKLDAKALSMFLNDYLGIMTKIVFAHDGTLDKYIGDAVMAFWGAPLDQPIHASNATKAAIAMIKALNENRERFLKTYGIEVDIGIGINTGAVSVGNMGSDTNFEYTVIGDHVNLASRLEGLTKAYAAKIVTTRFTLDSIQASGCPIPEHRVIDFVKVKGKHVAVELVQLLPDGISKQNAELFEEGRTLYKAQKWQEAIAKFKAAIEAAGPAGDGTAEVYIERCIEFEKSPPGPDWVGSWEMRTK
jgi:adenylate cyclase